MPIRPPLLPALPWRVLPVLLVLAGCTVGPTFVQPAVEAPAGWDAWHGGAAAPRATHIVQAGPITSNWWQAFGDPVLDQLEQEALHANADLRTASLNFAMARIARANVAAQEGPDTRLTGAITRQRQSEQGAGTRMIDVIGADRDRLAPLLAAPFSLYQAGFDASWEPDLWGRVRRVVEAADADIANQQALLDLTRLAVASEVARRYVELRSTQRQLRLLGEDATALQERLDLLAARVQGGTLDHFDLARQRTELSALTAQVPPLQAQEGASANALTLLLGERPGELGELLGTPQEPVALPDLSPGLPSDVAARRPDIRSAEAQLRRATADIGVAQADLYPSIRLGARAGLESMRSGEFGDWGSRTWSIGPSLDLPLFDGGRRQRVVRLREVAQQQAAVQFQHTVLRAWQEIDDALTAYAAERQQGEELSRRVASAADAYHLAQARYDGGTSDFTAVLDAQRAVIAARRDLVASAGRLGIAYIVVNKALGNTPAPGAQ